jgi:hypothetical protein
MPMRLPLRKIPIFVIIALIAAGIPHTLGASDNASIVDMTVSKESKQLEVSFRIDNCFTAKMEEAIQNGVPTAFRIKVTIEKSSLMLVKSQIVDFVLEHTIKYNRLNNEYQVYLQEQPQLVLVTKDFDEAKGWMSTVANLPVIHTCWLRHGQEYTIRIKAELSKVALPYFLRYILFWVSLWDFETDWQKVNFSM